MTNDAVTFTDVTRTYGRIQAVDGLDLTIARGETVALLGPNGAGKSTTMSLLLGLAPPGEGLVEVFGGPPAPVGSTVRNYLSAAIGRIASRNRIEAVRVARRNGWL